MVKSRVITQARRWERFTEANFNEGRARFYRKSVVAPELTAALDKHIKPLSQIENLTLALNESEIFAGNILIGVELFEVGRKFHSFYAFKRMRLHAVDVSQC
jgi:hypothetical protein